MLCYIRQVQNPGIAKKEGGARIDLIFHDIRSKWFLTNFPKFKGEYQKAMENLNVNQMTI